MQFCSSNKDGTGDERQRRKTQAQVKSVSLSKQVIPHINARSNTLPAADGNFQQFGTSQTISKSSECPRRTGKSSTSIHKPTNAVKNPSNKRRRTSLMFSEGDDCADDCADWVCLVKVWTLHKEIYNTESDVPERVIHVLPSSNGRAKQHLTNKFGIGKQSRVHQKLRSFSPRDRKCTGPRKGREDNVHQ